MIYHEAPAAALSQRLTRLQPLGDGTQTHTHKQTHQHINKNTEGNDGGEETRGGRARYPKGHRVSITN